MKPHLRIMLVVTITSGRVWRYHDYLDATITDPTELAVDGFFIGVW